MRARVRKRRRIRRRRRLLLTAVLLLAGVAALIAAVGPAGKDEIAPDWPEPMLETLTASGTEIRYGSSGAGRPLNAYRFGGGRNVLLLTFAVHGYEDNFAADGAVLVYTAYRMMDALAENTALLEAGDWTVYVLPCLNPDGLYDGYTNDGPGRCTTFSMNEAGVQTVGGVDMNRCFPTGWEPMTGKRNWNGSAPLACAEAAALAEFVREVRGAGDNICIDVHGWYQQTITSDGADGRLFSAFQEAFPDNTWADCRKGAGYFTAYTAELGYDSCLFEFPGDVYSFEGFLEKGYDGRFIDCVLKLLRGA